MKEISVGQYTAQVDDEDFDRVNRHSWRPSVRKHTVYAQASIGKRPDRHTVFLHRFILDLAPRVREIDHKDRNGLNNQRSNLHFVTHSENMKNTARNNLTTCKNGHPLDGVRTRFEGGKYCKTCVRDSKRRQRSARRDEHNGPLV